MRAFSHHLHAYGRRLVAHVRASAGHAVLAAFALACAWLIPAVAHAQVRDSIVPDIWQGDVLRPKPDMRGVEKLRFVTDSDYPPFHYYDEVGALTGFNVDLARAICEILEVECEVRDRRAS